MAIELNVNGRAVQVSVPSVTPLLDVLRNQLDLKGARYGCGLEQCGSCMVLLDGEPIYACSREVGTAAGGRITTIEGLGTAEQPHPLQQAFLDDRRGSAATVCPASSCGRRRCSTTIRHRRGTRLRAHWTRISVVVAHILAFCARWRTRLPFCGKGREHDCLV